MTKTFTVGDTVRVAAGYYWPSRSRNGIVTEVGIWVITVDMEAHQGIKFFAYDELEIIKGSESK